MVFCKCNNLEVIQIQNAKNENFAIMESLVPIENLRLDEMTVLDRVAAVRKIAIDMLRILYELHCNNAAHTTI